MQSTVVAGPWGNKDPIEWGTNKIAKLMAVPRGEQSHLLTRDYVHAQFICRKMGIFSGTGGNNHALVKSTLLMLTTHGIELTEALAAISDYAEKFDTFVDVLSESEEEVVSTTVPRTTPGKPKITSASVSAATAPPPDVAAALLSKINIYGLGHLFVVGTPRRHAVGLDLHPFGLGTIGLGTTGLGPPDRQVAGGHRRRRH